MTKHDSPDSRRVVRPHDSCVLGLGDPDQGARMDGVQDHRCGRGRRTNGHLVENEGVTGAGR